MNFKEIQDEVIASRFRENQRPRVVRWINWRYQWVNALADWPWVTPVSITVPVPFTTFEFPDSYIRILNVHDVDNDTDLAYVPAHEFRRMYLDSDTGTTPETYTLESGASGFDTIFEFGPPSSTTGSLEILYEARPPELDGDTEVPLWPIAYHYNLVLGATATGLKLENDPTWEALETEFLAAVEVMKTQILPPLQPEPRQFGREVIDSWP